MIIKKKKMGGGPQIWTVVLKIKRREKADDRQPGDMHFLKVQCLRCAFLGRKERAQAGKTNLAGACPQAQAVPRDL